MKFDFKNTAGQVLSGRLELPPGEPKAFALFAHCFTCSKNISAATRIASALSEQGIAVLRFDFTGLGNSEGDFSNTNFSSNVQDLLSAYKALESAYEAPQLLIGHSLGGAAVLKASTLLIDVKAVVSIAAPSNANHIRELFKNELKTIEQYGQAEVELVGRKFSIKKQLLDDIGGQNFLPALASSKKAYLIMHSPTDNLVSIENAGEIFAALKHPKSFLSLDSMDHLLNSKEDSRYVANTLAAWSARYLELKVKQEQEQPSVEGVLVSSRPNQNFTLDIQARKHHLVADEPVSLEGEDKGMAPYELLLSSLGACTAMTVKMYARRKSLKLDSVKVHLSHQKKQFDGSTVAVDYIQKKIQLVGDLTSEETQKLYEIADKCPVNRSLKSEIVIERVDEIKK